MAMDPSDGSLGLGGSFVENSCFRAIFARGTYWSEGVRLKKRRQPFVGVNAREFQAARKEIIEILFAKVGFRRRMKPAARLS